MSAVGMPAFRAPSGGSSRSSTPKRTISKPSKGVARAIKGMPRPSEENDVDIVEQRTYEPSAHEVNVLQHNCQFNVLVGIDPVHVEGMIRQGRAMLEQSMLQAAQAEQVAAEVYREACSRIQHLTEVAERWQHRGLALETQLLAGRESHSHAIIAFEAEFKVLAHKNDVNESTICKLESHCRGLEASLAAFRATAAAPSSPSLQAMQRTSEPAPALAPIVDAIQMLSQRLEVMESNSPNGTGIGMWKGWFGTTRIRLHQTTTQAGGDDPVFYEDDEDDEELVADRTREEKE